MKRLKNILYLMTICLKASVIGYFIYSYTQFNNGANIAQEAFKNGIYQTKDTNSFISFGSFKNSVICVSDIYYFIDDLSYEKGIFTMIDNDTETTYLIAIVDENIIYSSNLNVYFYNINLWDEV